MATTRGLATAIKRERFVEYIFKKFNKQAKLIEAHGGLSRHIAPMYAQVPEDTVIIFLSKFGQCLDMQHGRHIANEYFTSVKGLERFFRGEAGFARVHHGEIASRTFLPGEEYPNANFLFYDENKPDWGYVWKLPLKYRRAELTGEMKAERRAVTGANVYNNIPRGPQSSMTLQQVINKLGSGVYIISACLVPVNLGGLPVGKIPFNLPSDHPLRRVGVPRSRNARAYAKTIYGPKSVRPRTPVRTSSTIYHRSARRRPYVTVREMLTRLGRPGTNINLENWFPRMRVGVNKPRLKAVQNIIKSPTAMLSKLSENQKAKWNSLPWNQKGTFVANWLNKTGYIFKVEMNNKNIWFNGNTGRQIQPPNSNKIEHVTWTNQINNVFNKMPINRNTVSWWSVWRFK